MRVARRRGRLWCAVGVGAALLSSWSAGSSARADSFTFAGYTWDQDYTPNQLGLLGGGANLGGATFSAGNATTISQSVGFIATGGNSSIGFAGAAGFDPNLSLGKQATAQHGLLQPDSSPSVFSSAINLPSGNNGSTVRHGLSFSWTNGNAVANGAGKDFVIYESGSNTSTPEAFMVRARVAGTGTFTDWYYFAADAFQVYTNTPSTAEGAFAHGFDLSNMGLAAGAVVDAIQMANLISSDRIVGTPTHMSVFAQGRVVFDGSSSLRADAGSFASFRNTGYGSSTLDPDPLYVGILNGVEAAAAPVPLPAAAWMGMALIGAAGGTGLMRRRAEPVD